MLKFFFNLLMKNVFSNLVKIIIMKDIYLKTFKKTSQDNCMQFTSLLLSTLKNHHPLMIYEKIGSFEFVVFLNQVHYLGNVSYDRVYVEVDPKMKENQTGNFCYVTSYTPAKISIKVGNSFRTFPDRKMYFSNVADVVQFFNNKL